MRHSRGPMMFLLTTMLAMILASPGLAGDGYSSAVREYEGKIKSIRIDKCGLQPGLCEGSIMLEGKGATETALAIRVGTWIKRRGQFLTIEELKVGDHVIAQAFQMRGEALPRAAIVEFASP